MIGALLYQGTYFLVAQFGSYLIATLLLLAGIFLDEYVGFSANC